MAENSPSPQAQAIKPQTTPSLTAPIHTRAQNLLAEPMIKAGAIVFVWALTHHLLAGVRHLLSDIDLGSRLPVARRSAWAVNGAGLAVALLAAGVLLGVEA